MTSTVYGILAGYDGSPGSQHALRWAAQAARERDAVLTVCHAWAAGYAGPPAEAEREALARQCAGRVLARGLRSARGLTGPGSARPLLTEGLPACVLCELSGSAAMVVLGSRGTGGLPRLPLGSVSLEVAAYARSPVVVVRGHWRPAGRYLPGPVVAGVDGSAVSGAVLAFAGEEASRRGAPLVAVCALADAPGELGAARHIEEEFEDSVIRWEKDHPEVAVQRQVTLMSARAALLAATQDAQLLVVGTRGRGGLHGMMLGSVSQAMLCHAPCPVGVVHAG
jgi:nucleotide-binding universal stress UspA family protein